MWKVEGGWTLNFVIGFMDTNHEPLRLDKWSSLLWEIMKVPPSVMGVNLMFDEALVFGQTLNHSDYNSK